MSAARASVSPARSAPRRARDRATRRWLREACAVRIVVAGGGAAGLPASLLLARAGHEVVLVERDRLDPAPDVKSAATSAFRAAVAAWLDVLDPISGVFP
jgi:NADPH-dependent 2,4-dienoyl-CoA reductase/sulfur reductase-like enzyme